MSKNAQKSAIICTRQESQCLPYVCPHPAFKQTVVCKEGCRILTNLCHVDNFKSIRGLYFQVESHKTFCGHSGLYNPSFKLLSRHSWEAEVHFFITTNLQTIVRRAQGHPTDKMISRFVPWPMIYSFLVSKPSITY